jgi:hypothetical protein
MTETRHALVLALAMGAVGLVQGQGRDSALDHCRAGARPSTGPVSNLGLAANRPAHPGTSQCAGPLRASTRLAGPR